MGNALRPVRGQEIDELAARTDRRWKAAVRAFAAVAVAAGVAFFFVQERAQEARNDVFYAACLLQQEQARVGASAARAQHHRDRVVAHWHARNGNPSVARAISEASRVQYRLAVAREHFAGLDCRELTPPPATPSPVVTTVEVVP